MTTPLSKIAALFVLNRWYQNEAVNSTEFFKKQEYTLKLRAGSSLANVAPQRDEMTSLIFPIELFLTLFSTIKDQN